MTQVDFYFNAPEKLQVACRLAAKAFRQRRPLLIYVPEPELARRLDTLLWSVPSTSFVPHCRTGDRIAAQTPVLIAEDDTSPAGFDLLINLADECPPHFERFERLFEIVSRDEAERLNGRTRYRYYRDRGYPLSDHDLSRDA